MYKRSSFKASYANHQIESVSGVNRHPRWGDSQADVSYVGKELKYVIQSSCPHVHRYRLIVLEVQIAAPFWWLPKKKQKKRTIRLKFPFISIRWGPLEVSISQTAGLLAKSRAFFTANPPIDLCCIALQLLAKLSSLFCSANPANIQISRLPSYCSDFARITGMKFGSLFSAQCNAEWNELPNLKRRHLICVVY